MNFSFKLLETFEQINSRTFLPGFNIPLLRLSRLWGGGKNRETECSAMVFPKFLRIKNIGESTIERKTNFATHISRLCCLSLSREYGTSTIHMTPIQAQQNNVKTVYRM